MDAARDLIDAIPQPIVIIGRDERIFALNSAAVPLFGAAIEGRHYITALRQPTLLDAIEAVLRPTHPPANPTGDPSANPRAGSQAPQSRTARYLTADDSSSDVTYTVHIAAASMGVILTFEDITHLETAGQMRRDFVANVSHELRTPLTALLGFIETMLRGPAKSDTAARDRFLGIMEGEAERMNRLVGDLMSLNKVEAEERVRPTERLDLASLLTSVVHGLTPLAEEADLALALELPDTASLAPGDDDQLRQVMTNLIENAIKYGRDGDRVVVSLSEPQFHPRLRAEAVEISVQDFGPGIDPAHVPRLTERFYRVDTHRSREQGGTGLGLAIVKHIISRHRGRLTISSQLGAGSRFSVILPT